MTEINYFLFDAKYRYMIIGLKELHEYSDKLSSQSVNGIPFYAIQEVLAEKLHALIQRSYSAPRDLYDIWFLSRNVPDINWFATRNAFLQKMKYKNIEYIGIDQMLNDENSKHLNAAWKNNLARQNSADSFPYFAVVKADIANVLGKYFS